MTDSESEVSNSNVFTFQNVNTTVSARGPTTNISNFSFRNQMTSSTIMPRNFERQRYAESISDQRSIYYRRETSPVSIHSACDFRPRNFQQYYNGMGSHQSIYNGRSGSPVSMRSINSSASVSAADIAFAFKNVHFNKYDLKVIKEAYHKLMKQRVRKRIEKRRNMRLFLKGNRHRSGDDSGEQGSDSSLSSDDCRSVKTSYKEHMSSNRSARIDLTNFKKVVRDSNMVKDCTENFKQNNFKNMFSVSTSNFNRNNNLISTSVAKQTNLMPTQRDRFKNGFLLPSQRFNRSVASSVIPENSERHHTNGKITERQNERMNYIANRQQENNKYQCSDEEIFSEVSVRDKVHHSTELHNKRSLDSDDESNLPNKKKTKISSPIKNFQTNKKALTKTKNISSVNNNDENSNNFEFAKPSLPIRKSKPKIPEKVIAKSAQPLIGFIEPMPNKIGNIETAKSTTNIEKPSDDQAQDDQCETTQNSDVSMRPSFIKRKLFTQKLDVAEKANLSSDAINSPQTNVYSAIQKEKNKARKLVTSQSCLNREVQDDNNLLDLIHKIVPPDRMNITNQATINQTKSDVNNSNKRDDDDKWDVTSVISMCNENDVSDTFTDEEIFKTDNKKSDAKNNKKESDNLIKTNTTMKIGENVKQNDKLIQDCKVVIIKEQNSLKPLQIHNTIKTNTDINKSLVKSSAKTFWDTDFESDAECQITKQKCLKENQLRENTPREASCQEFEPPMAITQSSVLKNELLTSQASRWLNNTKNNPVLNNNLDNTRKFNISTLSVRSHRTTKKKRCCNETYFQEQTSAKTVITSKNTSNNTPKPEIEHTSATERENVIMPEIRSKLSGNDNKNSTTKACVESKKITVSKGSKKTENQNQISTKIVKPKLNTENPKKLKSTSRTRKSPRLSKCKADKQIERKIESNRPVRSCRTPSQNRSMENSRSSRQFNISPLNVTAHRTSRNKQHLNDNSKISEPEINIKSLKTKTSHTVQVSNKKPAGKIKTSTEAKDKTSKKPKTKSNTQNSNRSISSLRSLKSPPSTNFKGGRQISKNISNYQSPRGDRPIRSCRTPNHNRSIENYKSAVKGR